MLITSLRDLTSTVTVEAIALGLPVICPDHCGFADVIDASCGIRVPVTSPVAMVDGIRAAVELLGRDEEKRTTLARGAIHRADSYRWECKAMELDLVYRCVLAAHAYPAGP